MDLRRDVVVVSAEAGLRLYEPPPVADGGGEWSHTTGQAPAVVKTGCIRRKPGGAGRNERCPCGSGRKFKRCCRGR